MEMALLAMRPSMRRQPVPALVIGGEDDAIFQPSKLFFTALPWRAEVIRVPAAGHMLPIDRNWQVVAQHMLDWISDLPRYAGQRTRIMCGFEQFEQNAVENEHGIVTRGHH